VELDLRIVPEDDSSSIANDKLMDQACQKRFGSRVRAAEISEIGAQAVQGLPLDNNANLPLFGKGPGAKGKSAGNGKNFRVCWNVNGNLAAEYKQHDCGSGKKAVACVWDQQMSGSQLSKKLEEFKAGADELLGDVPVFRVAVGTGRCTTPKIVDACKAAKMSPLCNNNAYAKNGGTHQCWQDTNGALAKYNGLHFSLPAHNKQVGLKPEKLAGMCFSTGKANGNWALYNTGRSHAWTNSMTTIYGDGKTWNAAQQDKDGWFTWCISDEERELAAEMWEKQKVKIWNANMQSLAVTLARTNQGNVPLFKVRLDKGRCNSNKIAKACESKQMTPVCATTSYQSSKKCWGATGPYLNRGFYIPSHNNLVSLDKFALAGVCFYYTPNGNALYGTGGLNQGVWTQQNYAIKRKDGKVVQAKELDEAGWFTYCTLEKPTR